MNKDYIRKSNLEALKAAFEQNKRGANFKFWKPIKYGKYTVRFLPPYSPDGIFYKQVTQHKIGDQYLFCPKTEGDPCPICEKYKQLYDIGTDEAIALAKDIKPKKEFLYNIIVKDELGKPTDDPTHVYVYMSGRLLYDALMDYFFDEDYGDLTDVENGYDFVINKQQGDLGFPTYKNSKPRKNPSKLMESEEDIEKVLSNIRDLDKEVEYKSYDELKKILDAYMINEKVGASQFAEGDSKSEPDHKEEIEEEDMNEFEKELLEGIKD